MASETARLVLPLIEAGQAQKEMTHNEALALLDLAVQAVVEEVGRDTPPAAPAEGQCWIVGIAPTGAWSGQAGAIAGWTAGGWRFVAAQPGMRAWNRVGERLAVRVGAAWEDGTVRATRLLVDGQQVVAARQPGIVAPVAGGTVDVEARAAVGAILAVLRTHGLIAPA